jgi:hypothetical protein
MKIAVLAWSPFATDPAWRPDGPCLPIEFAKAGRWGEVIPVLWGEPWVRNIPTLWVVSPFDDFDLACRDLAVREGVPVREIGYVKLGADGAHNDRLKSVPNGPPRDAILERLRQWQQAHSFDAVIWRDSCADLFQQGQTLDDARTNVVKYLRNQKRKEDAAAIATYIQRVPVQIWTPIREVLAEQLGWVPSPPIKAEEELRFKDWQECRATIARLDTILQDFRKVGFSLITGLFTASAFLNFFGVQTTQGEPATLSGARAAVFIAVMVLVTALFSVDTHYQVMLSGAIERALDLEAQTTPPIRITKYVSVNYTRSGVSYIILALYLVLLTTAETLGLLAAGGLNLAPGWPTGDWLVVWLVGLVIFAQGLIGVILAYRKSKPRPGWQPVSAGIFLPGVTVGLMGIFLLSRAVLTPLDVWHWVAAAGMFLAIYIEFFWVYSAWRSGLYQQKPSRNWPEGPEKVSL